MVAKLVWSSESSSGAFKFADGNLHLLLNHDCLDRIQAPSTPRDGLSIELQDNGLYKFYSFGECYLFYNDKECNSIELSPKQSLQLICDDHQIDLIIDAKIAVNDPLIGTTLGGHKILERLGEGGVGVVYRAIQLDLEREVALKVLSNSAVDKGQSTVEAFKREAIAAGRMSHPGLVQVYSVGEDQGVHFFGMEVVGGGDAEEHLKSFGPFSESDAITIVLQVAEALKYASANNLIHRDIKPENLMMGSDGVKLADLGMASTRELAGDAGIGGTPHFMAPEMVSAPNSVDRRSDYYSLGCTLFRLLTAHTPFDGKSVNDILRAHRDEDAPHLSEYVEGISKGVQGLVDWLMSKDPEDRPQSADDIIHSCEELLAIPNRTPLLVISAAIVTIGAIAYFGLPSSDNEPVTIEKIVIDDAAAERNAELEKELERLRLEAERNAKENQTGSNEQAVNEVPESETESKQKEIAAQAKLRADLASETSDLVERQQLSAAIDLIGQSTLTDETKLELKSACYTQFTAQISALQSSVSELVSKHSYMQAIAEIQHLQQSVSTSQSYPEPWPSMLASMISETKAAESTYLETLALEKRQRFRSSHLELAFQPLFDFNIEAAATAIANFNQDDAPDIYIANQGAYQSLFNQAARAKKELVDRLSQGDNIRITDPIDGRRALVGSVNPNGITLLLQVRGERVPRIDNWSLFTQPQKWAQLLDDLDINFNDNDDFQALSLLIACSQASAILRSVSNEDAQQLERSTETMRSWSQLLSESGFNSVAANESTSLMQALAIIESINSGKNYSALQLLEIFSKQFSLIAVWSSSGDVPFSNE